MVLPVLCLTVLEVVALLVVLIFLLLFLPVKASTAVQAMKAAHITKPNCRF